MLKHIQVLKEPNREAKKKSRMWLFCSARCDVPVYVFEYHETRRKGVAQEFLAGWSGTLTTDGYKPYFNLGNPNIANTACLVHVRRYFAQIVKIAGGGAKAAENFGFFEKYTGISAGTVESGGDITGELLETFGVGGTPLGQEVMTVSLEGRGGQPVGSSALADVTRVGKGYVVTCAFAISEKPLNAWLEKNVLWQRLLLSFAQARYQEMVSNRNYGGYVRDNRASVDTSVARQIGVENTGSAALPKEGQPKSYMIYEDGLFSIRALETGAELLAWRLGQ